MENEVQLSRHLRKLAIRLNEERISNLQILQFILPSSASTSTTTLAEVSFNLHFSTPPPPDRKSQIPDLLTPSRHRDQKSILTPSKRNLNCI